jgi:hypothetical protein
VTIQYVELAIGHNVGGPIVLYVQRIRADVIWYNDYVIDVCRALVRQTGTDGFTVVLSPLGSSRTTAMDSVLSGRDVGRLIREPQDFTLRMQPGIGTSSSEAFIAGLEKSDLIASKEDGCIVLLIADGFSIQDTKVIDALKRVGARTIVHVLAFNTDPGALRNVVDGKVVRVDDGRLRELRELGAAVNDVTGRSRAETDLEENAGVEERIWGHLERRDQPAWSRE